LGANTTPRTVQIFGCRLNALPFIIMIIIFVNSFSAIPLFTHEPFSHPRVKTKAGTSSNWSGYVAESSISSPANGFVTIVVGSWKIPTLICNSSQDTYVSTWVGIDGYSDGTVEQIGTEQDCVNGQQQNYAWVEFYPNPSQVITGLAVNNGDIFNASITYLGNNYFLLSIKDLTTGQSYSRTYRTNAQRQSAEWVVEAPSSFIGSVLPLANFGTALFSNCRFVDNTGTSYAIDDRGTGTYDSISMNNPNGQSAEPSGLTDSMQPNVSSSFNVTYSSTPLTPQHDVAITSITLSKTIIGEGYSLTLNATAMNKGNYTESFNVTAYANSTSQPGKRVTIGTQTVAGLSSGESHILIYSWNTTGVANGNYTIVASAATVQGETEVSNNVFYGGIAQVTKKGDVNGDGRNNVLDLITVAIALGTHPGDAKWNPNADINNDRIVNLSDLILIMRYVGN
jgi:hypothetical protein